MTSPATTPPPGRPSTSGLPPAHRTRHELRSGPSPAFRSKDLELTNYDTSVGGLYLTEAATFPGAGVWGASGRKCATVVLAASC